MARIERFEDLDLWKDPVRMGVLIYKITEEGNMARDFSVRDQVRRAAISVSNNIAEGFEYNNNRAFVRKAFGNTYAISRNKNLIFKFSNLPTL